MDGCCKNLQVSMNVTLIFKREELLYDIGNYAYVEGDIMPAKEEHDRHQVMDVTEAGNIDLATRTLNLAHTEVLEALYPFTKKPVVDGEILDDELVEPEKYEVEMKVPETFTHTNLEYLRWLIHEYLVARVLFEWMGLTNLVNPGSRKRWEEKIERIKAKMKSSLTMRGRRVRIRPHPF